MQLERWTIDNRVVGYVVYNMGLPANVEEVRETLRKIQKNLECPIWCVSTEKD